jgi:hypothetical protein
MPSEDVTLLHLPLLHLPADLDLALESYPFVSMNKEIEDEEGDEKE